MPNLEKLNQPDFIARLQAGEDAAYRELDQELFPYFRNFVHKEYGLDKEETNDFVQDVAIRIFEKIHLFNPKRGRFEVWAFQILRNRFVDWLRDKKKYKATSLEKLQREIIDQIEELESPKDSLSPLEKLPPEVRQAILRLPDRYQQFLGLFLLGVQDCYIMDILKLKTRGAFLTLKSRVFSKLKTELEK
ncbi:MAG: sigma-70 family RNA polymerase sigma factor [candidate division KSB1 bacterium]|nr:sigma-70 family RNA polymerase sigma factor [candidate division KSB1 bacterium]